MLLFDCVTFTEEVPNTPTRLSATRGTPGSFHLKFQRGGPAETEAPGHKKKVHGVDRVIQRNRYETGTGRKENFDEREEDGAADHRSFTTGVVLQMDTDEQKTFSICFTLPPSLPPHLPPCPFALSADATTDKKPIEK
ncbi:hypothetical protein RUM43_010045 [Polyplax serrata]|uniref:Uncharacterized protein n=1 Tax=Polyplax serrata TaxID=468196 RepID=A0AAN8S9X0_POLSC